MIREFLKELLDLKLSKGEMPKILSDVITVDQMKHSQKGSNGK